MNPNHCDFIEQALHRGDLLSVAWHVHLACSMGLIAFVLIVSHLRSERRLLRLFALGYVFVAWTNLLGMLYTAKQWNALAEWNKVELARRADGPLLVEKLAGAGIVEAPEAIWIVPFHLILDAFVLVALWAISRPASPIQSTIAKS